MQKRETGDSILLEDNSKDLLDITGFAFSCDLGQTVCGRTKVLGRGDHIDLKVVLIRTSRDR